MVANVIYFLHKVMIQDEFNKVEITNDKQLLRVEFGKTQDSESTSKKENTIPEGDLNEKYVGKTIKKVTDVNVDYVNKVPTHASQTVVTSSITATGIAATAASTVVAASTVAVVAIATATGISYALHNYQYEFKSLVISSNELRYQLNVYDASISEEDYYRSFEEEEQDMDEEEYDESKKAPFKLHVYNKNYDAVQYLWAYSTNYGVFDYLNLGETYNIVLSENRFGGEEIFKDKFVTFVNSAISEFELYEWTDYLNGQFYYYLDYVDDDDSMSSIIIEFYDPAVPEEIIVSYSLEKAVGSNSFIDPDGSYSAIELNKEYGYRVSSFHGETQKVFKEDKITFHDDYGRKSEFRDFIFDKKADFAENTIDVQLDYDDDFGYYEDFKLIFTQIPSEMVDDNGNITANPEEQFYEAEINLDPVNSVQTKQLDEYEIFVNEDYFKYTYRLTCSYKGQEQTLVEEKTPFSFVDREGRTSEFKSFKLNKDADFILGTFEVQLDYVDGLEYYKDFCLHLLPMGINAQYDFYLDKTTDIQTCTIDYEYEHQDFSFEYHFTYYVTCTYRGFEGEEVYRVDEEFMFNDISVPTSEVYGITFIDGEANFETRSFKIQLDYRDDLTVFSDFVLTINDSANGGSATRALDPTKGIQEITIDDMETGSSGYYYPVDIVNGELTYNLSYIDSRLGETPVNKYEANQELVFENSLKHYFNKVDTSYDFYTVGTETRLAFSFDALDDAGVYGDIRLVIEQNGNTLGQISFVNEVLRSGYQYGNFVSEDNTIEDIVGSTVTFAAYCNLRNERTDEYTDNYLLWKNEEAVFTLDQQTSIYGIELSDYVVYGDWNASMGIIFSGSADHYDDVQLILKSNTTGNVYTYEISMAEFSSVSLLYPKEGSFGEDELDQLLENETFEISLSYCSLSEDPSDPTGATLIPSGPYSLTCYESFKFMVSH